MRPSTIAKRRCAAVIGHVPGLDADRGVEQRAHEVGGRSRAGRTILHLRFVRLSVGDEFLQAVGRQILARNEREGLLRE